MEASSSSTVDALVLNRNIENTGKGDGVGKQRKRIRSLAPNGKVSSNKKKRKQKREFSYLRGQLFAAMITFLICFVFVHIQYPEKTNAFYKDFVKSYKNHYYQIFYGSKVYCSQSLKLNLYDRLQGQVLNQNEVLKTLEETLNNGSRITSIAFVGSSGVGKTLLARGLQQNFPWPDNVHSYAWNTYVRTTAERFHLLQLFFDGLSDCGRNLLIIDNLVASDYEIVNEMQESLKKSIDKNKNVIVIFIFNLNAFLDPTEYQAQFNRLQNINRTTVINFRKFESGDLFECIEHEAALEKLSLTPNDINEILQTIEVEKSGCKSVVAKVLMYGKRT